MKKRLTLLAIFFIAAFTLSAQDVYKPWIIGVSANYTDFHTIERDFSDKFTNADWMGKHMPTQMRVGRMISPSFNITAILSTVTLDQYKMNQIPVDKHIYSDFFWKIGGQIEYSFANGYILAEDGWFDPYLFSGLSSSTLDGAAYVNVPVGLGLNFWLTDDIGVNFQGSYDYMFDFNNYMHYSTGLIVKFGNPIDKDDDRVPDLYDVCPDVNGLEKFDGCPDTDNDGIVDSLDECPEAFGPLATAGCPDFDKDGIVDKNDECPCDAGPEITNGCPDSDKDGVLDKNDHCPDLMGTEATNGCPDFDGDGVPDRWDICPEEAGPASNSGCPEEDLTETVIIPVEVMETIDFHEKKIEFDFDSAKLRENSYSSLDEIGNIMKEYPESRFTIQGYTDDIGPKDYNFTLSKERAESVKTYFTEHGISANRLEAAGFGEQNPLVPNTSKENRAKNRRVEIDVIEE